MTIREWDKNLRYLGQFQQPLHVDRLIGAKRKGFFLEVGAHDGIQISNSLFFETRRKWTGENSQNA